MSDDIQSRLGFMNFAPEQRDLLKTGGLIGRLIPPALDRFYDKVRATSETAAFFRDSSQMHKAQSAQEKHWTRIASGQFDGQFAEGVRRIGTVHATIGLEPRWYIGAYALVLEQVLLGLGREYSLGKRIRNWFRGPSQAELSVALMKAALLDMELSISIYFERSQLQRNKAIEALSAALKTLAAGNLTSSLGEMPADFQAIKRDYDQAVTNLAGLISDVSGGATQIQTGSAEIAQAAEDLARRTETTAATLEQTAAAVVQMDATLKATSASAERTVKQAEGAGETVARGRAVAGSAVQAMETVSRSATGIDDVIEGLDKIAFQTRVLAMNAAVEAGRAGEAGRGFAVVADLVSALAMRAEEEAKRARSQLTTTQAEIGMAVQAVENVDAELGKISTDVDAVHQLLNAIAKDNVAQAAAISEIRVAIGSMDVATQQNAAMVEETSAAARNLATEVAKLNEKTSHFDTGDLANEPAALRQRIASRMGGLRSAA